MLVVRAPGVLECSLEHRLSELDAAPKPEHVGYTAQRPREPGVVPETLKHLRRVRRSLEDLVEVGGSGVDEESQSRQL